MKRNTQSKMIAGICAGLSESTGISTTVWRLIFLAGIMFGSLGLWVYLALWIIMPKADKP